MTTNSPACPEALRGHARELLVHAIRDAYASADEIFRPEIGWGDHVHGLAVYHGASHSLWRSFDDLPGAAFLVGRRGPELRIGAYRVRWNKVGRGAGRGGIRASFPRGSHAAAEMAVENQLRLFDDQALEPGGHPANWILAHLGNPVDGLVAVYLCAPIESNGESVTGWREVVPIWSAADPDVEYPTAPAPGLPEPVELDELRIDLIDDDDAAAEA